MKDYQDATKSQEIKKEPVQDATKSQEIKKEPVQDATKSQEIKKEPVQDATKSQEIKKEPFLSQEQIKKIIIEGYINILKRWPDKDGMATYSKLLMKGDLTPEQFYDILINSDEYKERFGSFVAIPNSTYYEKYKKTS